MATAIFTVTSGGTQDAEDKRVAKFVVDAANAIIVAKNAEIAIQIPPGTPLPLWAIANDAQYWQSYRAILGIRNGQIHADYLRQSNESVLADPTFQSIRPLWKDATQAKRAAAIAALQ